MAGDARGERGRLREVVEPAGVAAAGRAHRLAPAPGEQLVRLAVPQRRVPSEVPEREVGVQHRRQAERAGAQAQLHVLPEQVHGRIERPKPAQQRRRGGEAGGDRPADRPRPRRPVRLQPVAHGDGQQRRVHHSAGERADGAGKRMGRPLHAPVRIQQPRRVEGVRRRAHPLGQPHERVVEQLAVRVEQHRHVGPRGRHAEVRGRSEAHVAARVEHLRTPVARERGPAVARPRVHDHELRPRTRLGVHRRQQPSEVGLGVVQYDDRREHQRAR